MKILLPGFLSLYFLLCSLPVFCQADSVAEKNSSRKWLAAGIHTAAYGGSLLVLNEAWYKDYPKRTFHSFNDSREWLQVDKAGHAWGAYHVARGSSALWKWAGFPDNSSVWMGGLSSLGYLTVIEVLDAHSEKWGWSWADMGSNLFGAGLFVAQEQSWKEQRIRFKFSFHPVNYKDPQLEARADELYGKHWYEKMLKDYNGQTYWLSANPRSFFPGSSFPAWLNISLGYGAEGMFGGFENKWMDGSNEITRFDIERKRQFYIAPDIDFSKIRTNSKFIRTLLSTLDGFKFPSPALMIGSKGKVKFYPLYF